MEIFGSCVVYVCGEFFTRVQYYDLGDKDCSSMQLQQQRVDTMTKAMQTTECLIDHRVAPRKDKQQ